MRERCPETDALAELMALAPGDPRRAHVDECPRCQAQWADLQHFLAPPPLPPSADPGDARTRMRHALDREFDRAGAGPVRVPGKARHMPWSGRWGRPRAAWGVAAGLVVVALAYLALSDRSPFQGPDVLREEPATGSRAPLTLEEPAIRGQELVLRWTRVGDADAYDVHMIGSDLKEVLVLGPLSDSTAVVSRGQVPGFGSGAVLGWRVIARRSGDEIARSDAGTLTLP